MRIFHGVVWSERALCVDANQREVLKGFSERPPLWKTENVPQIVIAPSHQGDKDASILFGRVPSLLLAPSTPLSCLGSDDFERYCKDALQDGVRRLADGIPTSVFRGPLGVIAPDCAGVDEIIKELTDSGPIGYVKWQLDDANYYYGVSLIQLASRFLIAEGVRPERVLYVTNIRQDVAQSADASVLAGIYASRGNSDAIVGALINVGPGQISGLLAQGEEVFGSVGSIGLDVFTDLGGRSIELVGSEFARCNTAKSLSMHPRCRTLLRRERLAIALSGHGAVASTNLMNGQFRYYEMTSGRMPWSENAECDAELQAQLFCHGQVFDHRTGAVCFDGYEWNQLVMGESHGTWNELIQFYKDVLEEPWQRDRPNYLRILAAPSKILLRGEEYYANLRNVSPATRISDLQLNTNAHIELLDRRLFDYETAKHWKLVLGYLDYLRNSALQIAWLENQIGSLYPFKTLRSTALTSAVAEFLDSVIRSYYATLGGAREIARDMVSDITDKWSTLGSLLAPVVEFLQIVASNWRKDDKEIHLETTKLIRRWREADHPGENLLIALHALSMNDADVPDAVGIGWGGIELPIVYRQVALIKQKGNPAAFAAHYSTYAKHGSKKPEVRPISPGASLERLGGRTVLLFDDNSLSGRTLQTVREHLLMKSGAFAQDIFLTRLSGERRYDQMRMDNHGLLDPLVVGKAIHGHLGETPFSRAWSRNDYENPIGVFSMARRRVLELLFSNSSADRFDREGF